MNQNGEEVASTSENTEVKPQEGSASDMKDNVVDTKAKDSVEKTTQEKEKENEDGSSKKKLVAAGAIAMIMLLGIAAFYYFGIYKLKPKDPSDILSFTTDYIPSSAPLKAFSTNLPSLGEPEQPRTEESPLNGLLFTKQEMDEMKTRRPVAVMINNHVEARPQSGLSSADIVFETNAESGITRYLAIFWSSAPQKVGSIRSLRQYYLEWLSEYDPILIHDGCAETDNALTNACGNIYLYGTKDIATYGSWRLNDGIRFAPHNEYSSVTNAWDYAKKMNWNSFPSISGWQFKKDADLESRGQKTLVKLVFHKEINNNGLYDVTWTYDRSTNSYLRKVGNKIDIDQENNTQVSAKNVVIQQVQMSLAGDDHGRLIVKTIGEGDAVILQDGEIINGTWKKTSRLDRTKYYDSEGKQIAFNRGKVWIEAIGKGVGEMTIIEQ